MKILCLSTWYPYPPDNGSKIRAYYLLRALERGGHQVTLVTFRPEDGVVSDGSQPSRHDGVEVHAVPVNPFRYVNMPWAVRFASPIPLAFWPHPAMQQKVATLARAQSWDAVVASQVPAARYGLQVAGVPRILDVDMVLSHQMHERYGHQRNALSRAQAWVSWQKAQRYEERMARKFQACTVVSPSEQAYVDSVLCKSGCSVHLVPNGVDCQHNAMKDTQPAADTLIFSGALTYSANYDAMRYYLAEVHPLIQQHEPSVALTITGSTTGVDMTGLPLDNSVHFSGYVDDVRPLVAGASVCIVPLRQGGGTRLKILEALALGTPVVSTSKGAEGLDVVDGEHLLLADTPARFADQTLRLLRDDGLRHRLATQGRRLVEERYDWTQIGQQFLDIVEQAAAVEQPR